MDAVRATDVGSTHFNSRGKYDSPQTVLCTVPQLFVRGKFSNVFDATRSMRVAQRFRLTWGADENFGLPTFVSGYKLTVEKRKREFFLCCTEMTILTFSNSALYCTPKLVATAAAFGRIGHYAVVIEHACDVLQISSQLVVRKLIGFCGNN
jgi:hypothetical protein